MITIKEIHPDELTQDILDILAEAFGWDIPPLASAKLILKDRLSADIHTFVIYEDNQAVGTASIIIEQKLCGKVGHIEEVAVHKDVRGYGYGKKIVDYVVQYARDRGCYKALLICSNYNTKFYKKCFFRHTSNSMRIDL
jgi:glucosamine-phosphate N-acetyltransferase